MSRSDLIKQIWQLLQEFDPFHRVVTDPWLSGWVMIHQDKQTELKFYIPDVPFHVETISND